MREKSRQEKLNPQQPSEKGNAKKRLNPNDPARSDIEQEIQKLQPVVNKISSRQISKGNTEDEENDFDPQNEEIENEPFGQDLNNYERQKQRQRLSRDIIPNEPERTPGVLTGEQAKVSAAPVTDNSAESLKTIDNIPGGKVSSALRGSGTASTNDAKKGEKQGRASKAIEEGKNQLVNRAKAAVKKAAAKAVAKFLAANPYTWVIVGIGLVLIIILFVVGISYMGTVNSKKPSTSGGTPIIKVEPKEQTAVLQNIARLTGNKNVTDQAINETIVPMRTTLTAAKDLEIVKNDAVLSKQIDTTLGALGVLEGNKTVENAQSFLTEMGKVYNLMEGNIPIWPTGTLPTRMPVNNPITIFNNDLHGNSFLRNDPSDNHNVYIRGEEGQEKCDAVDIGVKTGDAIYPIFGGKVLDVSSDGSNDGDGKKVVVNSSDGKYTALYAHIQYPTKYTKDSSGKTISSTDLKKGDSIAITEPLGIAKTNNIQIEVFYTENNINRCLVTNHADMIDHALTARRHQDWGGYLWDRVKTTFNLK